MQFFSENSMQSDRNSTTEKSAYLKEQIPIAPFTIGKDAQIMRLSRHLVQCLDRLFKEASILLATL
jgi:hypothetical protein